MDAESVIKLMEADHRGRASHDRIAALESLAGWRLPPAYREFLLRTDGFEGELGEMYINLSGVDDLEMGHRILGESYPSLFIIGTNGASEFFAFDRTRPGHPLVNFCTGDLEKEAEVVAADFHEFLEKAYRDEAFSWSAKAP